MTPTQCRMARGALNWSVRDLAREADISPNTIIAFEHGRSVRDSTPAALKGVFERRGIKFTGRSVVSEMEKT